MLFFFLDVSHIFSPDKDKLSSKCRFLQWFVKIFYRHFFTENKIIKYDVLLFFIIFICTYIVSKNHKMRAFFMSRN